MTKQDTLKTTYGNARIYKGYLRITSSKEGNLNKYLHRLIFENFHKLCLLPTTHIHHKDGNKLNNCILNLEMMPKAEHHRLHSTGEKYSLERKITIAKSMNTSGYFRVHKHKDTHCKQGFRYIYEFKEDGERHTLSSVSIGKLKEKVKAKGWTWIEYEEESSC